MGAQSELKNMSQWKVRLGPAGVHLFDRNTGLNILLDEITVPEHLYSRAPRQVSIALLNTCDLACAHCYAPKTPDRLQFDVVCEWLKELDAHGTLGVGFGGGEPTLYPRIVELCHFTAVNTGLAVSFTTHGHHITPERADQLRGNVHFIRVSMDGVGETYERIRKRSFDHLLTSFKYIRSISPFGINVVINDQTIQELDEVVQVGLSVGASELLLLPQIDTISMQGASKSTMAQLRNWVANFRGELKLAISELNSEGFPICDPLDKERGMRAYVHIDAAGMLKETSYAHRSISLGKGSIIEKLDLL